jgi:phosphoserine phosphatase
MDNSEIILMTINGDDKPGLTASLTEILAKHEAFILDIGQADIHRNLSLGIMFRTICGSSGELLKDLLFKANELDIRLRFTTISDEQYSNWVSQQGKNRYIITVLGKVLTAKQIASVSRIISNQGLNIDNIVRLTGRIPLESAENTRMSCVELSVRGTPNNEKVLHESFLKLSADLNFDISFQEESMYRRMRRLICFDMDSTLIQTEVIDELAERAGVGSKVKAITESAMHGEIDFEESFKKRIQLLKGLDESILKEVAENLPMTEGIGRLMAVLKKVGFKTAILSGGFTYFGNYLKDKYNFDYMYANELEIKDGKLTGNYIGDIVDGKRKAELLKLIAQVEKIDIRQTVAVGDGANDLMMLGLAGLGIAFNAKPKVKQNARQSLSSVGIDGILYFLGYKDSMLDSKLFGNHS